MSGLVSPPDLEPKPPVPESTPTKPVQSVAPQAWECGTDNLVDLWDGPPHPSAALVDLTGDGVEPVPAATGARPQPLLSFDEMMDGTSCSGAGAEDGSSLVDVTSSEQMTLSYQHALQHASVEDGQLLMTNGETLQKEGTQVRRRPEAGPARRSSLTLSACVFRPARAISANHKRRSSANQTSPRPNLQQSFITSHQVRHVPSSSHMKVLKL